MARAIGIDLGTTYSCMAYVNEVGDAEVIMNSEGKNVTPSVVFFETEDNVVVGEFAKENSVLEPKNTISFVKRLMGNSDFAIEHAGKEYSPAQVSSFILKKLVQDAERVLNEKIKDVVITCPAYFGTPERIATKAAGEIAELNVLAIINEPTAAAICYGVMDGEKDKTIMVYDLGGGTFDITIIQIKEENGRKVIEPIATGGDHQLGGQNWDQEIMDYFEREFRNQNDFEDEFDEETQLQFEQDMRILAEKKKQELTSKKLVRAVVVADGMRARIEFTRQKFEELTNILLMRTIDEVNRALDAARKKGVTQIDEILMVGGSAKMPQVERILNEQYPDIPKRIYDPDEAVAKGAAIFAKENMDFIDNTGAELSDDTSDKNNLDDNTSHKTENSSERYIGGNFSEESERIMDTKTIIKNITSKSFGIELVRDNGTAEGESYIENLIFANDILPRDETLGCATFMDLQKNVLLKVYESDITEKEYAVNDDFYLGEVLLELDRPMPKGSPIDINFKFDVEGILHVTGTDCTTGKNKSMELKSDSVMTEEQIQEQKAMVANMIVRRED